MLYPYYTPIEGKNQLFVEKKYFFVFFFPMRNCFSIRLC
nr:MAG TPA: hypothetical protein [Caudoviricetes sp.]